MVELLTPIVSAIDFLVFPCWSKIEIVYLCSEVSCLYISNAKLADFGEILISPFFFLALLVVPLLGGFAPPAAQANLRSVFHGIFSYTTTRNFALRI